MAKFKRTVGTEFGNPDLSDLAKAFGVRGFRIDHPSGLNSILREALESKVPCVVDIPVDYGDNPFLVRAHLPRKRVPVERVHAAGWPVQHFGSRGRKP